MPTMKCINIYNTHKTTMFTVICDLVNLLCWYQVLIKTTSIFTPVMCLFFSNNLNNFIPE